VADLALVGTDKHRHALPVARLELRVGVDVNHLERELKLVPKGLERTQHVFAKMAVGAPVKGQTHQRSAFIGKPGDRHECRTLASAHLKREYRTLAEAAKQLVELLHRSELGLVPVLDEHK
jgi:hypothetical protein